MQRLVVFACLVLSLSACNLTTSIDGAAPDGTPSGSHSPDDEATPSNPSEGGHHHGGGSSNDATPFQIAEQINVVTANVSDSKNTFRGVAKLLRALSVKQGYKMTAFDDAGTDYSTDQTHFFVHLEALGPLDEANMIMCYMSQLGASDPSTLNAGNYLALVDPTECERGKESGSNAESGESSGATIRRERIVVDNSRASENSPQVVKIWLQGGDDRKIRGEMTVTAGASEAPPFGIFTFNWVEVEDDAENPASRGSLVVFTNDPVSGDPLPDGKVGVTLYAEKQENFDGGGGGPGLSPHDIFGDSATFVAAASAVMGTDADGNVVDGVALTQMKVLDGDTGDVFNIEDRLADLGHGAGDFDIDQFSRTFAISYNAGNLLLQEAHLYDQLPFVLDAADSDMGTCLSRTEFDQAVWCYNLYNASTGERVSLETGFPFTIQKDACGDKALFGHLGYWGAWFEGENRGIEGCSLQSGDVVTRQNFNGGGEEQYEIVRSTGRLIKNTVLKLSLADLRGIRLDMGELPTDSNRFRDPSLPEEEDPYQTLKALRNSGDYPLNNWVVNYLTVADDGVGADGFYIVGFLVHGDRGPTVTLLADVVGVADLQARYDVTPRGTDGQQLWFYSQQLGGSVRFTKGQDFVTYNKEEFVDPADPIFGDSDEAISLRCLFGCLKANITNQDQSSFDGPMLASNLYTEVSPGLRYVSYRISRADLALKDLDGENIALANGAESTGMYSWGINMGPLVTSEQLESIDNWWDIWNTEGAVFYRWETGSNAWNTTTSARKEGTSEFATFDKPIEFTYTHQTANDRAGDSTYDGKLYLMSYQGQCQLHGFPMLDVGGDRKARFYPAFSLKDGTLVGPENEYVVKAIRGEQQPKEVINECDALVVANPAVPIPESVSGRPSNYNRVMPDVSVATVDNGVVLGD